MTKLVKKIKKLKLYFKHEKMVTLLMAHLLIP
jgi:hypothetical protein